ncbi:MAG: ribosomal-processing cysteine protease Prp [Lachnospiraceae bacterium]|nr:ribosomal-processing cysteine protease Prp [Lachnospiraceae bacterium]
MIRVQVDRNAEGAYTAFRVRGHAGYAEAGEDIVCAGVSAIVINTVNCLTDLTEDDVDVRFDEENGGDISVVFRKRATGDGQFLIDCMLHGLEWIKRQYGGRYLKYEIRD